MLRSVASGEMQRREEVMYVPYLRGIQSTGKPKLR